MFSKRARVLRLATFSVLSALAGFAVTGISVAQVVPPDFKASPDVYTVRTENDQYRVVQAIWKPGQRDQFHSHPAMLWAWVTDCSFRVHFPDGTSQDHKVMAGEAGFQAPIASHSLENVGTSECKIVMFESK